MTQQEQLIEMYVAKCNNYFLNGPQQHIFEHKILKEFGEEELFFTTGYVNPLKIYVNFIMIYEEVIEDYVNTNSPRTLWEHLKDCLLNANAIIKPRAAQMPEGLILVSNQPGGLYESINKYCLIYDEYNNDFIITDNK